MFAGRWMEDPLFTPTCLARDFCMQPGLKFLLRRTWSGQKIAPTAASRASAPMVRRIRFPQQGPFFLNQAQEEKSADLGVGGWKSDHDELRTDYDDKQMQLFSLQYETSCLQLRIVRLQLGNLFAYNYDFFAWSCAVGKCT